MTKSRSFILPYFTYALVAILIAGCESPATPYMLNPKGPAAAQIADLWWLMFWLAVAVFTAVIILSALAIFRPIRRNQDEPEPFVARPAFFLTAGGVIPLGILIVLLVASLRTSRSLNLPFANAAGAEMLTIEVIGNQWWWEIRYPDHDIVTANEIHIPAGEDILFQITSKDVIHSFWVPQLHGKIDMMDGTTNTIRLAADEPGLYWGLCAEFCGIQHTFMQFLVIAHERSEFDQWLSDHQQRAAAPTSALQQRGQAIFFATGCDHCHVIDGITAPQSLSSGAGPNLTHLAGRQTLAAARIENNRENLANWLLNPHSVKPGVHMPATPLTTDDLEALVVFLMSLE